MVCVDSDVLINFLRDEPSAINQITQLIKNSEDLSTTSVNAFELLKGVSNVSRHKEEKIRTFLSRFNILNFDFESSKKAAKIFSNLKESGNSLDLADIMIASIAITNNQPLLTKNKKHFERIEELRLQ